MLERVAAGGLSALCDVAEQRFSVSRAQLLTAMALSAEDLAKPSALVPAEAMHDLLLFLRDHTRDPGIGLRLGFALSDMLLSLGLRGLASRRCTDAHVRVQRHKHTQTAFLPFAILIGCYGEMGAVRPRRA